MPRAPLQDLFGSPIRRTVTPVTAWERIMPSSD